MSPSEACTLVTRDGRCDSGPLFEGGTRWRYPAVVALHGTSGASGRGGASRPHGGRPRQRSAALRDLVEEDVLAGRRRTREAAAAQERSLAELSDAATSAEHAADVLVDMFGEGVAPPGVLELLGPEDRARAVVTALSAARPGSLCALTLAAEVAGMVDGQLTRAAELLRLAIPMTDDPVELHRIAYHLARLGCVREALDMVEPHLAGDPREPEAAATYALALGVARLTFASPLEGPCPCGSDDEWVQCCRAAEATASTGSSTATGSTRC